MNYRLLRLLALAGAPVIRLCEGRYGVSRREFRLLALIVDGGPISPSRLSELAHLDATRSSRVVAALLKKQLVRREVQGNDRRFALLAATPKGRELHAELFPQIAEINRRMVSVLDARQVAALDEILAVLTPHAEAVNGSIVLDVRAERGRGRERRADDED
ncbi:MarR family winged helix-turn-helix transcriptional regulator [Ramlibacter pallidus]|uniref:MarR family transcriptional regulator n=1 Tax=Ramlibacter pallidus TaxID=2780087 RepID=A0ABR9S6B3_9BURK|nr:MarR family transcriptional regulator [Ramlibacter pallidus]MBE7368984.1 MarR family transcriptional regulator [Ramlibacter pallidus]